MILFYGIVMYVKCGLSADKLLSFHYPSIFFIQTLQVFNMILLQPKWLAAGGSW